MRRREFITLVGGAAAWPLAARAQDTKPARLVGVLMGPAADEDQQASVKAFLQVLKQSGWVEGRNVRFDIRWGEGRATETAMHTAEWRSLQISFLRAGLLPFNLCCGRPVPFR